MSNNYYMPVDQCDGDDVSCERREYLDHQHQWQLCRDIYYGIDSAKRHIVKNANEYKEDFNNRLRRSTLNNFVERIVNTMGGEIFRKTLTFEDTTPKLEDEIKLIPATGDSLSMFGKTLTETALVDGAAYIMVDAPVDGGNPYFTIISRSQLKNWRKDEAGNFTMAVIHEFIEIPQGAFGSKLIDQYRVLKEDGNVTIYRKSGENGANVWFIYEEITTTYNSIPLFELKIEDVPPLYDIATVNVKHMNFLSMQDDYLAEALSPMLFGVALGLEGDGQVYGDGPKPDVPKMVVGVRSMTVTDNPEARMEWVEMSGKTYDISSTHLEKMEDDMSQRALKLQNESVKNVTATATMENATEKNSRLTDIATDCEKALNDAVNAYMMMKYHKEFTGYIEVNKDFNQTVLDSGGIAQLNALQVSGNISKETLLNALQKAEVIDIDNIDDEIAKIEEEFMPIEEVAPDDTRGQNTKKN